MPKHLSGLFAVAALLVLPALAAAQETPTEREAARDVLKKMAALEQSLDVPGWVSKLTGTANPARDQVAARAKELMDTELLAMGDDITTHPEIGFEEKRSVADPHRLSQAARLRRADGRRRPADRVRREVQQEQRRAEPRRDRRVRRAARNEGRVPRRSAQRAGAGRHRRGDRDGRVSARGRKTPGSVTVFGTPGEEMMPPNAKTVMHEAHVFDGADILVRSHSSSATTRPAPGFGTCCLNIDGAKYTFSGAPAHQMTRVERPQRARRR